MKYQTKSTKPKDYSSGMKRDDDDGKPMFGFLFPTMIPYDEQLLTQIAVDLTGGAKLYGARNFELANTTEELRRYAESLRRHTLNHALWLEYAADRIDKGLPIDPNDEFHERGIWFNMMCAHMVIWKQTNEQ